MQLRIQNLAPGSFGLLFTNGTSTGAMKKVMTGEVDLIMGMYSRINTRNG